MTVIASSNGAADGARQPICTSHSCTSFSFVSHARAAIAVAGIGFEQVAVVAQVRSAAAGVRDDRVVAVGRKEIDHPPRLLAGQLQLAVVGVQGSAARLRRRRLDRAAVGEEHIGGVAVDVRETRDPECSRSGARRGSAARRAATRSAQSTDSRTPPPSAASAAPAAAASPAGTSSGRMCGRRLRSRCADRPASRRPTARIARGLLKRKPSVSARQKFRAGASLMPDCSMSLRAVSKSSA